MSKVKKSIILILFCILQFFSNAQTDTTLLPFQEFYRQVIAYHPIAKQARLLTDQAKAELRSARGAFDPVIDLSYRNKTTNSQNSYSYFTPELKLPTLVGIDVKAGAEMSSGLNLDPELSKYDPTSNAYKGYDLYYAGLSLPVGQGLMFDPRRAALRQAQVMQNLAEAEKIKVINKLLLQSAKDYWNWQQSYEVVLLMQLNVQLAENRLNFIINRIKLGEEKPIDSVEAMIEYKRREVLLLEARLDFANTGLLLSNYLWNDGNEPLALKPGIVPGNAGNELYNLSSDSLQNLVSRSQQIHPELLKLNNKIASLEVERKLNREMIKPRLTFDYFPFRSYTAGNGDGVENIFVNNYKFGVSFYSALFLRKERGNLQATNFKLKQMDFDLQLTKREIVNNVLASYNELQNLGNLITIQQTLVNNANTLRNAEETRFDNGESSLFLVNQRERSLIESQAKLVELKAKYAKAKIMLQWSSGIQMFD